MVNICRSEGDDAKECVLKKGQDLEMEFPSDIRIYPCLASCMFRNTTLAQKDKGSNLSLNDP